MKITYEHDGNDVHESTEITDGLAVNHLAADVFMLSARLNVPVGDIGMRFSVSDPDTAPAPPLSPPGPSPAEQAGA